MSVTHFLVGICLGAMLGVVLLVAGGLPAPAPPACHGCAVLSQPWHGCDEHVANGWICP